MIYLVSGTQSLFDTTEYSRMSLAEALDEMSKWDLIQYDSETSGRNPHLCKVLCNQFGNDTAEKQIVVDITTIDMMAFKNLLESKLLIVQNGKFDFQFLFNYGIVPTKVWDTMIAEQILFLGYDPKYFHVSLKAICWRRLQIDIDKTTRGEIIWRGLDTKVIIYAAGDVMYLEKIRNQQIEEAKKKKNLKAIEIENAFVPVNAYLEWCGIGLNVEKWTEEVIKNNEQKKQDSLKALNNWVIDKYKKAKQESTEVILKIKENNHGYIEYYDKPLDAKPIEAPFDIEENWGIIVTYQKFRIKSQWSKWITYNTQGDLFSGFDLEPKCQINWSSNKQLVPFFQYLGFSTKTEDKKTGESKDSVTEKVIAKQKGIADDFLKIYFAYKEAEKVRSTYGENYIDAINPVTGKIHTTFKQIGCASSRMSCGGGNKTFDTDLAKYKGIAPSRCTYVQCQNLPAEHYVRECFIPSPGNLMCSADFSALESRLGADIYEEPEMLEEFLHRSGDMHSLCAKLVFKEELKDIPIEEIASKRPDLRKKVKPIEFSQQFGGGAKAVANSLGCSKQEAEKFVKAYAEGFKGITEFKAKGSKAVREKGYVLICRYTGLKLFWEDWEKWKAIEDTPEPVRRYELTKSQLDEHKMAGAKWDRMALNSPTQGTGAEIIKLSMILYFKWICDNNYFGIVRLCDLVHDEAVIEFPENLVDIAPVKLKECMEKAASILCPSLPIPSVPEVGKFWIH